MSSQKIIIVNRQLTTPPVYPDSRLVPLLPVKRAIPEQVIDRPIVLPFAYSSVSSQIQFLIDATIAALGELNFEVNSFIAAKGGIFFLANATIAEQKQLNFDVDAFLANGGEIEFDIDAFLARRGLLQFDVGAEIASQSSLNFDLDTFLGAKGSLTFSINALLCPAPFIFTSGPADGSVQMPLYMQDVSCWIWGAGGSGGGTPSGTSSFGGGGGGGFAYKAICAVSGGNFSHYVVTPWPGAVFSQFDFGASLTIAAWAGTNGTAIAGGSAGFGAGTNDIAFTGGAGGTPSVGLIGYGGGGGGAAGPVGNGTAGGNALSNYPGLPGAGSSGMGRGGYGGNALGTLNGQSGQSIGGAGGGAAHNNPSTGTGGSGADGFVILARGGILWWVNGFLAKQNSLIWNVNSCIAKKSSLTFSVNSSLSSSGLVSHAISFNGTSTNYATGTGTSLPTGSGPMSISLWVDFLAAFTAAEWMFSFGNTGTNNQAFGSLVSHPGLATNDWCAYRGGGLFLQAGTGPSVNTKYNVIVTQTSGAVNMYVNNSLVLSNVNNSSVVAGSTFLGAIFATIWQGFANAKFTDIRVYNYVLSSSDRTAIYNSGTASYGDGISSGRVGWWKCNEGSGTTLHDSAGSNNMTINGGTWTSW